MKLNERITVKLRETFCNIRRIRFLGNTLESWKDFNWMKKMQKSYVYIIKFVREMYEARCKPGGT